MNLFKPSPAHVLLIILLIGLSSFPTGGTHTAIGAQAVAGVVSTQNHGVGSQAFGGVSTYFTGAWDVDYSKLSSLADSSGVSMNVTGFSKIIEEYFLPLNMRFVGLWIGWDDHANTSSSAVVYNPWVDDWLTASDKYGIFNVFYIRQWGLRFRYWDDNVIAAHPEVQAMDRNGNLIDPQTMSQDPIALGHPVIYEQYKEDLKQLYDYYGRHSSWIGFGAYSGDYSHYGSDQKGQINNFGFHPYHFEEFAGSQYFLRDVNASGFYADGTKSKFWEMYVENQPLIKLKSGNLERWGWGSPLEVYGGVNGRCLAMKFVAPKNLDGFQIEWYGNKLGTPGDLFFELYRDDQDMPMNLGSPLETVIQNASGITVSKGWQAAVAFNSRLAETDYYWIVMRAEGDSNDKYVVYRGEYRADDDTHVRYTTNGYSGSWSGYGSAFIIIKDANGVDAEAYPFRETFNTALLSGQVYSQPFTAPSSVTVNSVWVYLVDRAMANDPRPLPVSIVRASDGAVMAQGQLNPNYTRGVYWWTPIFLNQSVSLIQGGQYSVTLGPPPSNSVIWQFVTERADPAVYGFQGQSSYLFFALADMQVDSSLSSHPLSTPIAVYSDPITDTDWMAVGFTPQTAGNLQEFSIKIRKTGSPSDLRVALYGDNATPSSIYGLSKPNAQIEAITVPDSNVPLDGWLNVTGWTTTLNPSQKYWVVLSQVASSSGQYTVYSRNPNYILPFVYSTDASQSWKWGFPYTNTPAEPLVSIITTGETITNEPWEYASFSISGNSWAAQSFIPQVDTEVRGVAIWLQQGWDNYDDTIVELRKDDGSDSPADSVLILASIKPGDSLFSANSLVPVDFRFPVLLNATQKYWIVLRSETAGKSTAYAIWSDPNKSFRGTTCKAKVTTDGGQTWSMPNGREADLVFDIISLAQVGKTYSVSELTQDLTSYESASPSDEPAHGWNAYLCFVTSRLLGKLGEWFEGYTGKPPIVIDTNPKSIRLESGYSKYLVFLDFGTVGPLDQPPTDSLFWNDLSTKVGDSLKWGDSVPWSSIGYPGDNMGKITSEQIRLYNTLAVPSLASQLTSVYDWSPGSLANGTQQTWSAYYGEILNRMRYAGGFFGKEKEAVKALFIGDMDTGVTLQFLTPAIDVTFEGFLGINGDLNLTKYGDFSQFDVIAWLSSRPGMNQITQNAQVRIKSFVQNGGGFAAIAGWAPWADDILGFSYTNETVSLGTMAYVNYSHPIIKPFSDISPYTYYWRSHDVIQTTGTYIVKDTNNVPWISENHYGAGRGVFVGIPINRFDGIGTYPTYFGAPRDSWLVLFTNSIFYAAKKESMLPVWWYQDAYKSPHSWNTELRYSVDGTPGGPVLLWLSNNNGTTRFEFHLNASFYGIDENGWLALDVQRWKVVAKGSGQDVAINVTVPADSWMPIYIVNATSNLQAAYSNFVFSNEGAKQNSGQWTLQGFRNQTGWFVLGSDHSPSTVATNNTGRLNPTSSIDVLNSTATRTGWYYDSASNLLFIKVRATSAVQLQVEQEMFRLSISTSPPSVNGTGVISVAPEGLLYEPATVVSLAAQLTVGAYTFDHWIVNGTSYGQGVSNITVSMVSNRSAVASYVLNSIPEFQPLIMLATLLAATTVAVVLLRQSKKPEALHVQESAVQMRMH